MNVGMDVEVNELQNGGLDDLNSLKLLMRKLLKEKLLNVLFLKPPA